MLWKYYGHSIPKKIYIFDHKIFVIIINPIFHHTRTRHFLHPIVSTTHTLHYNYKPILHHIPKAKE